MLTAIPSNKLNELRGYMVTLCESKDNSRVISLLLSTITGLSHMSPSAIPWLFL